MRNTLAAAALLASLLSAPALAAEFRCSSGRVEKSGSTKYTYRDGSSEIRVEKSGSTKGKAVKRGSKWYVEVSGSTQATFENGRIEKGGSSWATVGEAQRTFDCPGEVAATLWVLQQKGHL